MFLKRVLFPSWLKKIDLNLLINYPMVWETRILHFTYFGLLFGIFATIVALFFPFNFPNIPSPQFFFFAGLIMFFIALSILIYYVQDQNRQKKKVFTLKESYALFGLYLINGSLLFCLPLILFLALLENAQQSIEWEKIDYFSKVVELYNREVDNAQLATYAPVLNMTRGQLNWNSNRKKIDYSRFEEPELHEGVLSILTNWNKGSKGYAGTKLQETIEAIDFTIPINGKSNYYEALQNRVFNETMAELVPGRFKEQGRIRMDGNNPIEAFSYLNDSFQRLERLYNRKGTNNGRVSLSIIGLLLLFFSVNWCLLSRGYTYAGTNFISLVFVVLAAYLLLCSSEFIYHTVVNEMEHFNAMLSTPFLAFAALIGLTYMRRNNVNNHYLLTLTTLALVFLAPIFYYNLVSAEVDLIWRDSAEWRNVINPISVFLLFILVVVLVVHSLMIYSRFNINPKR